MKITYKAGDRVQYIILKVLFYCAKAVSQAIDLNSPSLESETISMCKYLYLQKTGGLNHLPMNTEEGA